MTVEVHEDLYAKIFKKAWDQHIPFTALWEITYKCNLRCVHCYITPDHTQKELSLEECQLILDQLAAERCLFIVFTGGEFLTRSDFFDVAQYARRKGFALRLFTNGTLITAEVADRIKDLSPIYVGISIYAGNPATHDAITQVAGSFSKSINALELLRERGVKTVVKCPLMRDTVHEFDQVKRLAEDLGAGFQYGISISPKDDGSKGPLTHRLTDDGLRWIFMKELRKRLYNRPSDDDHFCGAGLITLAINPYGEVFPCVQLNKMKAGYLRRDSLHDVWKDSKVFSQLRSATFSSLTKCPSCDLAPYCVSCRGVALLEDGDWLGPSTAACREARIRKEVVQQKGILIKEGTITQSCERI